MLKTETVGEYLERGGEITYAERGESGESDCPKCRRVSGTMLGSTRCFSCVVAEIGENNKRCRKCKTISASSEFRGSLCKPCYNGNVRQYVEHNREKVNQRQRQRYEQLKRDPERLRAYRERKKAYDATKEKQKTEESE